MRLRGILLVASLAFLHATPARSSCDPHAAVQPFAEAGEFMGAVLVARGDSILLDRGYGMASIEWQVPNTPATRYRIASLTKQFTAVATLLLEERGKLSVDAPARRYLPQLPQAWSALTVAQLLDHTSGIASFTDLPEYASFKMFPARPGQILERVGQRPLMFPPGSSWEYNNSGYVLLGELIEQIGGISYAQFLAQSIFEPLAMADSGVESSTAVILRLASGYVRRNGSQERAEFLDMSVPSAAGAIYSTTHDLLKWQRALFGGRLLGPKQLDRLLRPNKEDYAFGLSVHALRGRRVIEHSGGIEGFNTFMSYYPGEQVTVIALGNQNGAAPQQIAERLGELAHRADCSRSS